jgi:hypothetical protein
MAVCDVCGNDYDKSFEVRSGLGTYTFDSFECAIHKLAPQCAHCQCRIVGHGVESEGQIYCCANCARHAGVTDVVDRAPADGAVEALGRAAMQGL